MTDKIQKLRKMKDFLQKMQKPLAFFCKVCYNVPVKRTDVFSVGSSYDF